jgi:hypothetical protein
MGLFSIKAASPEKIEPCIQYYPGPVPTHLSYKPSLDDSSYDKPQPNSFNYFSQTGTYFLGKNAVKLGGRKVPYTGLGTRVYFNTEGKPDRDDNIVKVEIPRNPSANHAPVRFVDMSDSPFTSHLEMASDTVEDDYVQSFAEASFCISAIAKGIFEHLHNVEEPAWMQEHLRQTQGARPKSTTRLSANIY